MWRLLVGVAIGFISSRMATGASAATRGPSIEPYRRHLDAALVRLPDGRHAGKRVEGHIVLCGIEAARIPVLLPSEGPSDDFTHGVHRVTWKRMQGRVALSREPMPGLIIPSIRELRADLRARGFARIRCPDPETGLPGAVWSFCIPGCCGAPGILASIGYQE